MRKKPVHRYLELSMIGKECTMNGNTLVCFYTILVTRKHPCANLKGMGFQNRPPSDPKGVPWDQNFGLKNFLISSSDDVILCILWICFAKNV